MATARKAALKAAAKKTAREAAPRAASATVADTATPLDAIRLLTNDHREVKALFQQYQELVDEDAEDEDKHPIAEQICLLLTVHARIEEDIFYPAAEEAIEEPALVDEAAVEHGSARELIAALLASNPSDDLFDARVKVLGEYVEHHVREEERQMFPQARKAKMDLQALGGQLALRRAALMSEMGLDGQADEDAPEVTGDDDEVAE